MRVLTDLTQPAVKAAEVITDEMIQDYARSKALFRKTRRAIRLGLVGPPVRHVVKEYHTTGMEYRNERREFVPRGQGRKKMWAQS